MGEDRDFELFRAMQEAHSTLLDGAEAALEYCQCNQPEAAARVLDRAIRSSKKQNSKADRKYEKRLCENS